MKTNLLRPDPTPELRINLRVKGKTARTVVATMAKYDVDAPTAVRILLATASLEPREV